MHVRIKRETWCFFHRHHEVSRCTLHFEKHLFFRARIFRSDDSPSAYVEVNCRCNVDYACVSAPTCTFVHVCRYVCTANICVHPAIKLFAHFSLLLFFFLDVLIYGTLPWFNSVLLANVERTITRVI